MKIKICSKVFKYYLCLKNFFKQAPLEVLGHILPIVMLGISMIGATIAIIKFIMNSGFRQQIFHIHLDMINNIFSGFTKGNIGILTEGIVPFILTIIFLSEFIILMILYLKTESRIKKIILMISFFTLIVEYIIIFFIVNKNFSTIDWLQKLQMQIFMWILYLNANQKEILHFSIGVIIILNVIIILSFIGLLFASKYRWIIKKLVSAMLLSYIIIPVIVLFIENFVPLLFILFILWGIYYILKILLDKEERTYILIESEGRVVEKRRIHYKKIEDKNYIFLAILVILFMKTLGKIIYKLCYIVLEIEIKQGEKIERNVDRMQIDNLKNETIQKKIEIVQFRLQKTNDILNADVLSFFEDETWYSERNYFKKFLEYKNVKSKIYGEVDCDVSLPCIVMYVLMSDQLCMNNICYQYASKQKYEIRTKESRFKGDTLTSAIYTLKLYMGYLWKKIDNDDKLKKNIKYRKFYNLFHSISKIGIPVVPTGDWNAYCYQNSDIIWEALDISVQNFLKSYTKFGNYMRIPGNSYKIGERWTSFNMARSNGGQWDTIDKLLSSIYLYYKYNNAQYLSDNFTVKQDEITQETIKWLGEYKNWEEFLEGNILYDFVDHNLVPISLKTGHPVSIQELDKYNPIPSNYDEFLMFFQQVSERIDRRSKAIHSRLFVNR